MEGVGLLYVLSSYVAREAGATSQYVEAHLFGHDSGVVCVPPGFKLLVHCLKLKVCGALLRL